MVNGQCLRQATSVYASPSPPPDLLLLLLMLLRLALVGIDAVKHVSHCVS